MVPLGIYGCKIIACSSLSIYGHGLRYGVGNGVHVGSNTATHIIKESNHYSLTEFDICSDIMWKLSCGLSGGTPHYKLYLCRGHGEKKKGIVFHGRSKQSRISRIRKLRISCGTINLYVSCAPLAWSVLQITLLGTSIEEHGQALGSNCDPEPEPLPSTYTP
jgi:hypothetical protein